MHCADDQDSCYYNFSCLRPIGDLLPANNVFSNIAYIAVGLKLISNSTPFFGQLSVL